MFVWEMQSAPVPTCMGLGGSQSASSAPSAPPRPEGPASSFPRIHPPSRLQEPVSGDESRWRPERLVNSPRLDVALFRGATLRMASAVGYLWGVRGFRGARRVVPIVAGFIFFAGWGISRGQGRAEAPRVGEIATHRGAFGIVLPAPPGSSSRYRHNGGVVLLGCLPRNISANGQEEGDV